MICFIESRIVRRQEGGGVGGNRRYIYSLAQASAEGKSIYFSHSSLHLSQLAFEYIPRLVSSTTNRNGSNDTIFIGYCCGSNHPAIGMVCDG